LGSFKAGNAWAMLGFYPFLLAFYDSMKDKGCPDLPAGLSDRFDDLPPIIDISNVI
jgi:hypothetical protein